MLTPDTSVELLFKDSEALVDVLKERPSIRVKYNPQARASQANSRRIVIGSRLPLAEIKIVLVETLTRYPKLQYYSVSNDFYRCEFYKEFEISVGLDTRGAKERGLAPIEATRMMDALETFESTEQLIDFVRAHYQGEVRTFEIEPIAVTSYHSATVGAVDPPASSQGRITGSEYLSTTNLPELYGLTIRMYVDSLEEFIDRFPEVGPMAREWIDNRGASASDLAVCVNAEEPLHEPVRNYLVDAYADGRVISDAPATLRISLVVANRANDARMVEVLTDRD